MLIAIDPIYKVMGKRDEKSAGDINSLMNELDKLAVASASIGCWKSKAPRPDSSPQRMMQSGIAASDGTIITALQGDSETAASRCHTET